MGRTVAVGPQATGAVSGKDHPEDRVAHRMAEEVELRRRRVATRVAEEMVDLRVGQPRAGMAIQIPEETVGTRRMTRIVEVTVAGTHFWADS